MSCHCGPSDCGCYQDIYRLQRGEDAPYQVLYIEDNPSHRKLLSKCLDKQKRFSLLTANDGEQGLSLCQQHQPDVILLDINLPGVNGFGVMEKLKHEALSGDAPVIALSANAMAEDLQRAEEAGFFAYLTKPIDIEHLCHTIHQALVAFETP